MAEINGAEISTLNGVSFDIGATKLCKIVRTGTDQYSLIIKISLEAKEKIIEKAGADGLVTLSLASDEDPKNLENNIHDSGTPDVHFIVRNGLVYLNVEVPTIAKKQTSGA